MQQLTKHVCSPQDFLVDKHVNIPHMIACTVAVDAINQFKRDIGLLPMLIYAHVNAAPV